MAWGAYNAFIVSAIAIVGTGQEYIRFRGKKQFPSSEGIAQMGVTFLLVLLGWILFRSEDISQAAVYLERMFNVSLFSAPQLVGLGFGQLLLKKCFFFTALMFIVEWIGRKQAHGLMIEDLSLPVRYVIYTVVLIIIYGFSSSNLSFHLFSILISMRRFFIAIFRYLGVVGCLGLLSCLLIRSYFHISVPSLKSDPEVSV